MKSYISTRRGFTIIEILVVIAIIGILSGIVLASLNEARKLSRDNARIADIEQLALAMRLYVEQYGSNINCVTGLKIDGSTTPESGACGASGGDEQQILNFLDSYFGGDIPSDPLGPGNSNYYYYFDGVHDCTDVLGANAAIVFATDLEANPGNATDVCGDDGGDGGYTSGEPYVKVLPFVQ